MEDVIVRPDWREQLHVDSVSTEGGSVVQQLGEGLTWLWVNIRAVDVPSFEEYFQVLTAAVHNSLAAASSWLTLLTLTFSPFLQFLGVLGRGAWPPARAVGAAAWRAQVSLPLHVVVAEFAVIAAIALTVALHSFIARRRYIPRSLAFVRRRREVADRRYRSFTAWVERKYRLSARAFPHVVYWAVGGLLTWFLPATVAASLRNWCWDAVTVFWPVLYAAYLVLELKSQAKKALGRQSGANVNGNRIGAGVDRVAGTPGGGSNNRAGSVVKGKARARARTSLVDIKAQGPAMEVSHEDVDRVLMYWVVFSTYQCLLYVVSFLPLMTVLVRRIPSALATMVFFFFMWMHLPGQGSGLGVVYSVIEPLVNKHVKNVRPPGGPRAQEKSRNFLSVLVLVHLLTEDQAQIIVDNVTDSWMLLPTPFFIFTPGFITYAGCVYAGLVVPALNSIK
ncbi:unnamed protein product, partial [Discosporangium mesarthrocarpum]